MSEMQAKVTDVENLQNEFRNQALALERVETERLELAQKLHENYEKMESITKERNDLKELQESFEIEKKQLKEYAREMESAVSHIIAFLYLLNVSLVFNSNVFNWKEGRSIG